jgi:hypothetical protein
LQGGETPPYPPEGGNRAGPPLWIFKKIRNGVAFFNTIDNKQQLKIEHPNSEIAFEFKAR